MYSDSVQRAADLALDGLRHGEGGLAVYKAAQLYGVSTVEVGKELAARRRAKAEAKESKIKSELYRRGQGQTVNYWWNH